MNADEYNAEESWRDWMKQEQRILAIATENQKLRSLAQVVARLALQLQTYDDPDMRDAVDELLAALENAA